MTIVYEVGPHSAGKRYQVQYRSRRHWMACQEHYDDVTDAIRKANSFSAVGYPARVIDTKGEES